MSLGADPDQLDRAPRRSLGKAITALSERLERVRRKAVALVKEQGREALAVQLDATSQDANEAMAQAAIERFLRHALPLLPGKYELG